MKLLLLLSALLSLPVSATPTASLQPVGQGQMHWLVWKLYDIQLYSQDGRYATGRYPVALSLRYARDIPAQRLVEATLDEWQRMQQPWNPDWRDSLLEIWPSVKQGDELTLLVPAPEQSRFYHNGRLIGEIRDADFSRAFLAIWLSERSREPQLRDQLLGKSDV